MTGGAPEPDEVGRHRRMALDRSAEEVATGVRLTRAQIETIGQIADGMLDGMSLVGPHDGGDRWALDVDEFGDARLRDVECDLYIKPDGTVNS